MTKFNCKIQDLSTICNLVSCAGKAGRASKDTGNLINDMLMNVSKEGVNIIALDSAVQALFVKLSYKVKVIENGEIPISDIARLSSHLNNYSPTDDVEFSYSGGKIKIERKSPKKVSLMPTSATKFIESLKGAKDMDGLLLLKDGIYQTKQGTNFDCVVEVNADFMKGVLSDASTIGADQFPLEINKDVFKVMVGEEGSEYIETNITTVSRKGEAKTKFSYGFDGILKNLHGSVKFYTHDKSPIIFEKQEDKYNLMYFLAPKLLEKL